MAPSEQQTMLLKSPSKAGPPPGLARNRASKVQLPAAVSGVSNEPQTASTMSRGKSRVQLLEPDGLMCLKPTMSRGRSKALLTKVAPTLSRAKSRPQLAAKKEVAILPLKKSLNKTRSRAILKDKNDPISVITDDAVNSRNGKKKPEKEVLKAAERVEEEERLDEAVTAVVLDHSYSSPSSPVPSRAPGRITFSDVSVFFFDRTAGGCSVPRNGAQTMGMEARHTHMERRLLPDEPGRRVPFHEMLSRLPQADRVAFGQGAVRPLQRAPSCTELVPGVRRKLFNIKAVPEPAEEEAEERLKRLMHEEEKRKCEEKEDAASRLKLCNSLNPVPTEKKFGDYRATATDSDSDSEDVATASADTPKSRAPAAGSTASKRSLSRAYSGHFPVVGDRKASVTSCPPCKTARNGKEETPATCQDNEQQKIMIKTRSSSRLNGNIKSLMSLPKNYVEEQPKSMLTPKSLKSSKGLSRAFTTVSLKVQAEVNEPPSEPLPKPSQKLVSSITTSCLKSFQSYHVSPEALAIAEADSCDEETDLPVTRPKLARSETKKLHRPPPPHILPPNAAFLFEKPPERGSLGSGTPKRKVGASGTRGLTPLGERARVGLLRAHGVQALQGREEQEELESLRDSREKCGCSCSGPCQPDSCECSQQGIHCQVERAGFPCSCGPDCANPQGRRAFDETEVSMHYINTMMGLRGVMDLASSQESITSVDIGTF